MAPHECIQAQNIGTLTEASTNLKNTVERLDTRVNGTFEAISDHIKQGARWRIAILGIVFAGIVQVVGFAYFFGQITQIVRFHTQQLEELKK